MKNTQWLLFQCDGGSRWSEGYKVLGNAPGQPVGDCNFSGCNCGGMYKVIKTTADRQEASEWFRNKYPFNS